MFISCSDTVHRSRFSLSSFPLLSSLTDSAGAREARFFSPPAPAPARYSVGDRAGGSPAKRALKSFLGTRWCNQEEGTGRSNSLSSISSFLLVRFLRQNDASAPFYLLPSPLCEHASCRLHSELSLHCSVPTESTVKEFPFDFYRRPENDLSVTTVSANLGGRVSMREREMPFIPRHSHPETSHQAAAIQPPFTASRTIM